MRPLADIYAETGGDKGTVHSYIDVYTDILAAYRNAAKNVLEIGIYRGESLRMWEQYFARAAVYGVDVSDQPYGGLADLRPMIAEGKHRIVIANASVEAEVEAHLGGIVFNVVVDDASHDLGQQVETYRIFKKRMAPDGIYIIEDIQDIDAARAALEQLDSEKRVEILDRRAVKGRYDDVLVVVR